MVAITYLFAGLMTIAVQALPSPQGTQPSVSSIATPAKTRGVGAVDLVSLSAVGRFQKLLTKAGRGKKLITGDDLNKQIVFSFSPPPRTDSTPKGGVAVAANIGNFPILTGLGISATLGFMEPCAINTPHVHPRATEFLTLVEGSNLSFGYVLENGLVAAGENTEVAGTLQKFEGTVFPQGSIHFQFNNNCEQAVFVAGLNSDDPGTNQVAQGFFALNADVINAALNIPKEINGKNIEEFRKMIPANLAQNIDVCLAKCGKKN